MKTLLGYTVTKKTLGSYLQAQGWQEVMFPGLAAYPRVIVSDGLNIEGAINLSIPDWTLCKAQNYLLKLAEADGYDYLYLLDSDVVITQPLAYPSKGYTGTQAYKATEAETADGKILDNPAQSFEANWFMFSKECFKFRYCEEYQGLHFTDCDFVMNVLFLAGIHNSCENNNRGIHLYHGYRSTDDAFIANAKLFHRRTYSLHPKWTADIFFKPFENLLPQITS